MNLTNSQNDSAKKLFSIGLTERYKKLNLIYLKQLEKDFDKWISSDNTGINAFELSLLRFMIYEVNAKKESITKLKKTYANFNRIYLKSIDNRECQQHIIKFCADLGATDKMLREDKKAFSRWFGIDAAIERYQTKLYERQRCLAFYLDRLGSVCGYILPQQKDIKNFWRRYKIEDTLRPLLVFDGDDRVRVETFKCLARAVNSLPVEQLSYIVSDATVQYIYRSALERSQDIWIQREALGLLTVLSHESLQVVLQKRINHPVDGDDIFVRRHAVKIIGDFQNELPELQALLYTLVDDPGASVRQLLPAALLNSSAIFKQSILSNLLRRDSSPAVRASVLLVINKLSPEKDFELMQDLLLQCIDHESDEFVIKTALKVMQDALLLLDKQQLNVWAEKLLPLCQMLHSESLHLSIRRMAAQVMEWFWLYRTPSAVKLYEDLLERLQKISDSQRILLPASVMKNEIVLLGRVMSLLAQQDYCLTLEKGWRGYYLRKGERFAFRWWRFLHEFKNSSTDKRQSHRHTIGRHYYGLLHAPSSVMSELAETRVPGEPLFISEENASRYYLPLVDHALAALDQGWPTKYFNIVSAEGVTCLYPPENIFKRFKSHLHISTNFAEFARLRNWQDSDGDPSAYIQALVNIGFKVEFKTHEKSLVATDKVDTSVSRFFPALIPFNWDNQLQKLEDYFFSVYENTLFHLGVFVMLVSAYFFTRHIILNKIMQRARDHIPLVIGGWGTRGKSGTERLKAALFNAMGYSVVSKTTGCEAMFLHAPPFGALREMFLFRPYDKATIWEQVDVVRMSQKLGCDVFLWECMGLTPSYVHVLQRNWMRDDIATITNTYPDHEDLQGPAGYDIPRVMTNFIPQQSTLITSEEQMLPVLRDSARQLKTHIRTVGWLQAGLICDDILQRFPYEEHPYNIALVLEMADELGIERDFALKEMADNVVPDLGVLKTFPVVNIAGRQLEFINGMSANERFGALGNWSRMLMDQHDLDVDAGVWVTTVINNRADRVARSQVFASIMVQDIAVDRHILIGDNLHGLLGYIQDAWQDQHLSLFADGEERAFDRLDEIAKQLRVPVNNEQIKKRLMAMLDGVDIKLDDEFYLNVLNQVDLLKEKLSTLNCSYSDEIIQQFSEDLKCFSEYKNLMTLLSEKKDSKFIDSALQKQAWLWFEKKLIVVENYYARGDEVVQYIVEQTPPGLKNRVMGMQNIKGTGLDFIYRWQAWETCYLACEQLNNKPPLLAEEALKSLTKFQEFGVLCEDKVLESIDRIRNVNWTQREEIQAELSLVLQNLQKAIDVSRQRNQSGDKNNNRLTQRLLLKLAEWSEAFMDAGDAVKRRKRANQIYKDMIHKRISHERAAVELQLLNKRQKGGWGSEYINQLGRG